MDIVPALTGMRIGIQLATDALAARDDAKVKAAMAELSHRLADANMGALDMSEHLRKLEGRLREAEAQLRDAQEKLNQRKGYMLREVRPGAFVYAYDAVPGDPAPAHFQCQICFDAGKGSVLHQSIGGAFLECKVDKAHRIQLKSTNSGGVPLARRLAGGSSGGWMGG